MKVHLVDGTFELFRAHFGSPEAKAPDGREVGAVRGLMRSLLGLLSEPGVTHVGVAFDHTVESFRNQLYSGYKTGEGIDPVLFAQFPIAEAASSALGFVVWPMVEFEADDALATASERFSQAKGVTQVVICSPDKDLAQCVVGHKVICRDRMRRKNIDAAGVKEKFGVAPASIPDWLGLVGDSADGLPGIPRWGAKSAAAVLGVYEKIERIPDSVNDWQVDVRGARTLAENLSRQRDDAMFFRELATLRRDVPMSETLDELLWRGPDAPRLVALAAELGDDRIVTSANRQAASLT
jgi:5'-3' exonuclease